MHKGCWGTIEHCSYQSGYNMTLIWLQIIFEGIAGTGYYGSDVSIDDVSVSNDTCVFTPVKAKPASKETPQSSKLSMKFTKLGFYIIIGNCSLWNSLTTVGKTQFRSCYPSKSHFVILSQ